MSHRWTWLGGAYVVVVMMLAAFAVLGSYPNAFLVLLAASFPIGYVMYLPIYVVTSLVDSILGIGLEGSPVTSTIVSAAGFGGAAALNVLIARSVVRGLSKHRNRTRSDVE